MIVRLIVCFLLVLGIQSEVFASTFEERIRTYNDIQRKQIEAVSEQRILNTVAPVTERFYKTPLFIVLWFVFILLIVIGIVFWVWKKIRLEMDDLEYLRYEADKTLVGMEGQESFKILISEGKSYFRKNNLLAIEKFQASLEHKLSDEQRAEVFNLLGMSYIEQYRSDNHLTVTMNVHDTNDSKHPEYLEKAESYLHRAKTIMPHDDLFQLDTDCWLIALYALEGKYESGLDIAKEALNFAEHSGEKLKAKYVGDKIRILEKRISEQKNDTNSDAQYPKELELNTVEVL